MNDPVQLRPDGDYRFSGGTCALLLFVDSLTLFESGEAGQNSVRDVISGWAGWSRNLGFQLSLLQPGGAVYAHHNTACTPSFEFSECCPPSF